MSGDEYTPTTDEVRERYVILRANGDRDGLPFSRSGEAVARAEFDRWLCAERARVLREAAETYRSGQLTGFFPTRDGYTQAWLTTRADRIEAGEGL